MNENQLQTFDLQTAITKAEKPVIEYDLSELQENVTAVAKRYKGLVITEADIEQAKTIKAGLNKISKALNRKRIDLIKELSEPLDVFKNEIDTIKKEIDEVSEEIDTQLKVYEEQRKEEKKNQILALPSYKDFIIFNEKWLNVSVTLKSIEQEIDGQVEDFNANVKLVRIFLQAKSDTLDETSYIETLKKGKSVAEITEMIEHDISVVDKYVGEPVGESKPQIVETTREDVILTLVLKINATKDQFQALKEFFERNNIKYEKV